MIVESLVIPREQFEAGTGWELRPEGACRGDTCIPVKDLPTGPASGDTVDVAALAAQLSMPLVADENHPVWAVGPAPVGGRALVSAEAPDLTLPNLDGEPFELRYLRGQKVILVAWSPY